MVYVADQLILSAIMAASHYDCELSEFFFIRPVSGGNLVNILFSAIMGTTHYSAVGIILGN